MNIWNNRELIDVEIKSKNASGYVRIPLMEAKTKNEALINMWVNMFKETLLKIINAEIEEDKK